MDGLEAFGHSTNYEHTPKQVSVPTPEGVAPPEIHSGEWMDALAKELRAETARLMESARKGTDIDPIVDAVVAGALIKVAECVERTRESASIVRMSHGEQEI